MASNPSGAQRAPRADWVRQICSLPLQMNRPLRYGPAGNLPGDVCLPVILPHARNDRAIPDETPTHSERESLLTTHWSEST